MTNDDRSLADRRGLLLGTLAAGVGPLGTRTASAAMVTGGAYDVTGGDSAHDTA